MKKIKCEKCELKWGVSVMVKEEGYTCPHCRSKLGKKKAAHKK